MDDVGEDAAAAVGVARHHCGGGLVATGLDAEDQHVPLVGCRRARSPIRDSPSVRPMAGRFDFL